MAIIKHGAKDRLSGKIADLVYRNVKGRTIVASLPAHYTKPTDPESKRRFKKFAVAAFIAKNTAKDEVFYHIWNRDDIPGAGSYHKFIKINYSAVNPEYDFKYLHLAPPVNEFQVETTEINMSDTEVLIKINPLGLESGIKPERELYIHARGFMFFTHVNAKNLSPEYILNIHTENQKLVLDSPLEFHLKLKGMIGVMKDNMDRRTLMIILITSNSEENPVRWSETILKLQIVRETVVQEINEEEE